MGSRTRGSTSRRARPLVRQMRGRVLARFGALGAVLLMALMFGAPALAGRPAPANSSPGNVLEIYQSSYITAQSTFSVYVKVADSSQIHLMYYSFCQLTNGVCYTPPVTMTDQGSNLWVGTTSAMTEYSGMTVGVKAGYNLTVQYDNGGSLFNLTYPYQPTVSNPFSNLTVTQSVPPEREWLFEMEVENQVYNVAGTVTDSSTGHALGGATVTLAGTNTTPQTTGATGSYSFPGIPNGTYSMSVAAAGYRTSTVSVSVRGGNTAENVRLVNASAPNGPTSSSSGGLGFLETPLGLGIVAAAIAVLAGLVVGIARARRRTRGGGGAPGAVPKSETAETPPKSG
jgi:hypothetical protein